MERQLRSFAAKRPGTRNAAKRNRGNGTTDFRIRKPFQRKDAKTQRGKPQPNR
jgi:hypothetical protein